MGIFTPGGEFLVARLPRAGLEDAEGRDRYFLLPPARGQGIATEAVKLLAHYAFDHMGVNRVWATCDAGNAGSANVLRRAGVPEEGRLRAEMRDHHGRPRDTLMFGLCFDDYPAWREQHGVPTLTYL